MALKGTHEDIHEMHDYGSDASNGAVKESQQDAAATKGGTAADLQDMHRMGRVQELRVRDFTIQQLLGYLD